MSKVDIKKLDSLSHNDSTATKLINDNFAALKKGVEDSLSRTGKTPNFMDAEHDMNSRRIINLGRPVDDNDAVSYGIYKEHIDKAVQSAEDALNSEKKATAAAGESKHHANNAKSYAETALEAAKRSEEAVDQVEEAVEEGISTINQTVTEGKQTLEDIVDDYYTKEQIDEKTDLSNYYTKSETRETFLTRTSGTSKSQAQIYADHSSNTVRTFWINHEEVTDMGDFKYAFKISSLINVATNSGDRPYPIYNSCQVTFDLEDALSGNFAPLAKLEYEDVVYDDGESARKYSVTIYSKTPDPFYATVTLF